MFYDKIFKNTIVSAELTGLNANENSSTDFKFHPKI